MLKRLLTTATHRIYTLPVIVLMPHSRCNCRCVMCDIWKANQNKQEISPEELKKHALSFKKLGVKEIVFSGGEALMHSNLWSLCSILREHDIRLTLLSTGLMIERHASEILDNFKEVIVSIDGSKDVHDSIRNIPNGFEKISAGIAALKKLNPSFRITARCVLQRYNFRDLTNTVKAAREIGIDQISFLAADVTTTAFNHTEHLTRERISEVALSVDECLEFDSIVERSISELRSDYNSKFIAESPQKMRRLVQYYNALNGLGVFPIPVCNAPWVSAVIESDGRVMPCFFHKPYGNIYEGKLVDILNSPAAVSFRRTLNVERDPVCRKCVCSLKLPVI